MSRKAGATYALTMAIVIVAVDILWLRHHAVERLVVNVGVVLVFVLVWLRFLGRP